MKRFFVSLMVIIPIFAFSEPESLRIASLEYPPFIFEENNEAKGKIVEIVKEVFHRLKINTEISIYPVARGLKLLESGDVDAYFTLKRTAEREKKFLFTTQPLIQQSYTFFARSDSGITYDGVLSNMAKYLIGIVNQTSYGPLFDEAVKNSELPNIDISNSFENNFMKLQHKRVDLVINSYDVGIALIKRIHAEDSIIPLFPPVEVVKSYLAFGRGKDFSSLARRCDEKVQKMKADGPILKIDNEYGR